MKKLAHLILAVSLAISFASFANADDFELIGREISPGIDVGARTVGALFVGKFFDSRFSTELGRFTVTLDHNQGGIEECGGETRLLRFKLIMNFNSGARLVLLGPTDGDVSASWDWNDPACEDGNCPLIGETDYAHYLDLFDSFEPNPIACQESGSAFIAAVDSFGLAKQRFGSYGTAFKSGSVSNGYLVHTPIISPAIFGSLTLSE
jgi:hypothetical protein